MTSPLIWIVLPAVYAGILFIVRRWERTVVILGILISLLLAWFAWVAPIGETMVVGPWRANLDDTLTILGRRFVLDAADAPVLTLIYLGLAFWFGGSIIANTGNLFVPIGLANAALLTAAIAVQPFLYSALLIELVTIISIPLISPPNKPVERGTIRFLTFQTLAMPLILFTGWILTGVESGPPDSVFVVHGNILLALGFAFLLAIFPFHTWVTMLAEETHPYVGAFIFYTFSLVITFFGISFLERYAWLRTSTGLYDLLRVVGILMVAIAGFWVAFQKHLGRMLGYAVLMETGLSLLILSAGTAGEHLPASLGILFASILPRGLAFAVWALALSTLMGSGNESNTPALSLHLGAVQGRGRKLPVTVVVLVAAMFSLAGFPLLAGFPVRLALWEIVAKQSSLAGLVALLGGVGLLTSGLRTLGILISGADEEPWLVKESRGELVLMILGGLGLFLVGVFPQWFLPALANLADIFFG